jgi:hypothetical protein
VAAPPDWQNDGVTNFYQNPNNAAWGQTLCRVLYHESIHFWQFLSCGYIANLVGEEWARLLDFENSGRIRPHSNLVQNYRRRLDDRPFSAGELAECWARYWDVHTRSPALIIREDGIDVPPGEPLEFTEPGREGHPPSYTGRAFDTFMQQGRDAALYAQPYRWMLQQASGHSAFVAITFPAIVHSAFQTPDPIGVFCQSFERAVQSPVIRQGINRRSGNINVDWLNSWTAVQGEVVASVIVDRGLPSGTSGFDVISRGPLRTHPIFPEYLEKGHSLAGHLNTIKVAQGSGPLPKELPEMERYALADMPSRDRWVVFGLPGQPDYRYLLGRALPPPRIAFANFMYFARRPVLRRLMEEHQGQEAVEETYETRFQDLDRRIRRFRAAEKAVSLGLPPNAFER